MSEPPPILNCARVLEYAEVDASVRYTGQVTLYVGNKRIEAVSRLAICQNMGFNPETFLFHCDSEWNVVGAGAYSSVEAARERAESAYEGIFAKWQKTPFSATEAEEFLAEAWGEVRCAFCGKTPNQVHALVQGKTGARICDLCVAELQEVLQEGRGSDT